MRLLPLLAVLLLVSLPLAGAQQGCGDDCAPDDARGGRPGPGDEDGNETSGPDGAPGNQTGPPEREDCSVAPDAPRCRAAHERFRADAGDAASDARHVSFRVDRMNRTLHDYAVGGLPVFDAVILEDPGDVEVDVHGAVLRIRTNESVLRLHDAPRGNLEYRGDDHGLVLDLPAGAFLDRHGKTERGHFLLIDYGDRTGKLAADHLVIDGDRLHVRGHAAFHVEANPQEPPQTTPARQAVQEALADAEHDRQLGARVAIRPGAAGVGATSDARAGAGSVEVTAYDDLDVNVSLPTRLRAASVINVTVSAELEEGRTVALELDPAVLDGLSIGAAGAVAPRYYDLNDDGTWTEVVFRKADGIQDILDAQDDAGQPEFWIVQDEQGIQVLVSFPHWSTHRVSLVLDFLTEPSVLVGVVAGLGGVAVAAATLFLPRRREEELY